MASRSNPIFYVYVYGEYLGNVGVNESILHADEDVSGVLYHPKQSHGYVDGVHHDNANGYEIKIREYEYGHDSQLNVSKLLCSLK